jgi:hypothetical protein
MHVGEELSSIMWNGIKLLGQVLISVDSEDSIHHFITMRGFRFRLEEERVRIGLRGTRIGDFLFLPRGDLFSEHIAVPKHQKFTHISAHLLLLFRGRLYGIDVKFYIRFLLRLLAKNVGGYWVWGMDTVKIPRDAVRSNYCRRFLRIAWGLRFHKSIHQLRSTIPFPIYNMISVLLLIVLEIVIIVVLIVAGKQMILLF